MTYTYVMMKNELLNMKEEHKEIPLLEYTNTWQMRLKTLQRLNDLLESGEVKQTKSFYPKLTETKQAGHRAWQELKRKKFCNSKEFNKEMNNPFQPEYDHNFLDMVIKRKKIPKVYFNSICFFDWDVHVDQTCNAHHLEWKYLRTTNIAPKPVKHDINLVDTRDKIQVVYNTIKETEFSHDETLSLIILLCSSLGTK